MSAINEIPVVISNSNTPRESLTPHKLTIAILIKEYCKIRENGDINRKFAKSIFLLILRLLQSPDLSLQELRDTLTSDDTEINALYTNLLEKFDETVKSICNVGVRVLLDILDAIGRLAIEGGGPKGLVNKCSVVGYFTRRIVVSFERLTFSEITMFLESYQEYAEEMSAMDCSTRTPLKSKVNKRESHPHREWSRRQAELFIATQSALLMNNEQEAMGPKELHENIKSLLKSNHDLAEAHFLSYLNYLRVKEFSGAIDSLYTAFDSSVIGNFKGAGDEKTKSYRFAALNLAILHYHFNHYEESLAALKEAIKMAQEANDNVCLQHSLSWLYCLTATNRHKLMEHSVLKSLDLNLSYIMSLGILSFIQFSGVNMGDPKQLFDTMTKSDVINCQHIHTDLVSTSYAQKSAVWLFYGKTEMASLWSQLLLYLNTDNTTISKTHYGEGYCQALCTMSGLLQQESEYNLSNSVLAFAKERFPNEPISHNWMTCESVFNFQITLYNERYLEAQLMAEKLNIVNEAESCLRVTEVLIHKQDYKMAHECINKILAKCRDGKPFRMDVQVRAMLLLADVQICTSFPDTSIPGILGLLHSALAYCDDYNIQYLAAMVQLYISHVQLLTGMPAQASSTLNKCLVQILAHGNRYDRARARLLQAKCLVANASDLPDDLERVVVILKAVKLLGKVKDDFTRVEAYFRAKDVVYLQAQLYHELNMSNERNQCAMEYRLLEEDYPLKNATTLLTTL